MRHRFLINEFAARAGVTVKALHLYDRLGLLVPARSEAGHRLYTTHDLVQVRRIVTLKRLGVPLRRIGAILANPGTPLGSILSHERHDLEERRERLDGLIRTLRQLEPMATTGSSSEVLDSLIEKLAMQDSIDVMRKYYSVAAWPAARAHYDNWPSEAWRRLYEDVNGALDADPGRDARSELAQAFGTRWMALDREDTTDPAIRLGLRRAWADRRNWPDALRARFDGLNGERVVRFIAEVLWERSDSERLARERLTGVVARVSDARRLLYDDGSALLGQDPSAEAVGELVARWVAIVDDECGGDLDMKVEMVRSFRARHQWPAGLTRSIAAAYGLDTATWSAVANLIDSAYSPTEH